MHRSESHLRLMVATQRGRALPGLAGRGRRVNGCGVALDFSCEMDCSRLDDFTDVDRRAAPRGEDRWRQTSVSFCPL
jgi:hypothetical protein